MLFKKIKNSKYYLIALALKKIVGLMASRDKNRIVISGILLFIFSVIEVVTIASIYPFLQFTLNQDKDIESKILYVFNLLSIDISDNLALYVGLSYLVLVVFSAFFKVVVLKYTGRAINDISNNLATKIFNTTLFGEDDHSSSEIVSNIILRCNYAMGVMLNITSIVAALLLILGVVYFLLLVNYLVTIIGITILALSYSLIAIFTADISMNNSRIIDEKTLLQLSHAKRAIDDKKNIIIENRVNIETNEFRAIDRKIRFARLSNYMLNSIPRVVIESLIIVIIVIIVIFLSVSNLNFKEMIPIFGLFALSFQKLLPSINALYVNYGQILQASESITKLASQITKIVQIKRNNIENLDFSVLELKGLGHFIQKTDELMYKPITSLIKKGDKCIIRGPNGVGKTTILESIIGLTTPDVGKIMLNNKLLEGDHLYRWWNSIAYMPQQSAVYDKSLLFNITLTNDIEDVDIKKYDEVCSLVFLDLLSNSSKDLVITENGKNLSGGERQRIVLARALYLGKKVLFLDESLNAVDPVLRKRILTSVIEKYPSLTIMFISHNKEDSVLFNKIILVQRSP
jgi:ATP-binding cassette, subfamily B, bacterial PglK